MKIGIIGVGFVGGAVKKYFSAKGGSPARGGRGASGGESSRKRQVLIYDKFKGLGSIEEINRADIVFICVPTPYQPKRGFDVSAVADAVRILKRPKIIVIKSSVIPGSTDALQKKYSKHKILFNPEFLKERAAYQDLIHPYRQILGITRQSRGVAHRIMRLLPNAHYQKVMPALEAEVVKYMANSFLALRVVFANEFYDICKKLGADYQLVKEAVSKDPRIGGSHFDIFHNGYRGYGGSCLPKDVNSIIQLAESKDIKTELLMAMRALNKKYLRQNGLTEEYFLNNHHKKKK